jgi:hypothetical protein
VDSAPDDVGFGEIVLELDDFSAHLLCLFHHLVLLQVDLAQLQHGVDIVWLDLVRSLQMSHALFFLVVPDVAEADSVVSFKRFRVTAQCFFQLGDRFIKLSHLFMRVTKFYVNLNAWRVVFL